MHCTLRHQLRRQVIRFFKCERGSAVLEFIMVALPLFVPLAMYLGSVEKVAQTSFDLQNIARQVARAFTTSPSEALAPVRAREVLSVYQNQILPSRGSSSLLNLNISCEENPCLTPNGKVTITVTANGSKNSASATQIVDAWRSTG